MSVAPSRSPLPKSTWRLIKAVLAEHGVAVQEDGWYVIVDDVGDEYTTFAVLYAKGAVMLPARRTRPKALSLGGSNDVHNRWPEPRNGARLGRREERQA